jgi:hypothetical protein
MFPNTRTTRIGCVSVAVSNISPWPSGDDEVAAEQGEESGHSRSSFPVRWM